MTVRDTALTATVAPTYGDAAGGYADGLRRAFDSAFAQPPPAGGPATTDLLAITVGTVPYAVPLAEVAGLHVGWVLTPVPSPLAELLGLTAVAGRTVPVYDLGAVLSHRSAARTSAARPRWLMLTADEITIGLAFERLDAHLRVVGAAAADVIPTDGPPRAVLRLPAVQADIAARVAALGRAGPDVRREQ